MSPLRVLLSAVLILSSLTLKSQETLNHTDEKGLRQGRWVKRFENGNLLYEGTFKDGKPVGEFKRYYNSGQVISILTHSEVSDTVDAIFYYPGGFLAASGRYHNQNKIGEWKFYSEDKSEAVICVETYENNNKIGISKKYHLNGNIAEEITYVGNIKHGPWKQYYTTGITCIRSTYINGKLNGKFETFHTTGTREITGNYKNDVRTGDWQFYAEDGPLRKTIRYINGIPENNAELIRAETEYLDKLEREGGKIKDPQKTGVIW